MLTTGPVSEVLPVEVDNNEIGHSSFSGKIPVTGILLRPSELRRITFKGHSNHGNDSALSTPSKKVRPRPVSEQVLSKTTPQGIHEESDGKDFR